VPLLVLMEEGKLRQSWVIQGATTTIGRWEDNDVAIADRWISRHHARIDLEGTRYAIQDLGSKNGLFVNGKRVTRPVFLEDGDRIQLAPKCQLTFVDNEATAPLYPGQEGVVVDQESRRVWVGGQELVPSLSSAQFVLLQTLMAEPGRVFSRDELIDAVWPDQDPSGISDDALNSLVRRLRGRLVRVRPGHRYVFAIRGHGFKFEQP
jgi:pSer/pThr/pTyr-binding forkhead associated (FHA) protein